MVVLAPASILPNTPDLPDVRTSFTLVNPASWASFAMYSGPCGKLRFSAAIDGSAIHSCKRLMLAACIFGICASTAALSASLAGVAANTPMGTAARAAPETALCTKSRLLSPRSCSFAIRFLSRVSDLENRVRNTSTAAERGVLKRAQMSPVVHAALGIIGGHFQQIFPLLRRELTNCLGRRSDDEATIGKRFALGDERAGTYQAGFADDGAAEHDRLDSNQRALAHRTAMHHGLMTDRNMIPDGQRKTRIGMQHRPVLHVAVRTDANDLVIPSQCGAEPHRRVLSENDFSDHRRVRSDIRA